MFWDYYVFRGLANLVLVQEMMISLKYFQIVQDKKVHYMKTFANGVDVFLHDPLLHGIILKR